MKTLRFILGFAFKLAFAVPLAALLFVLATSTGAQLALDIASRATNGAIRGEEISGRLLGHLQLKNLVYEDLYVRVDVPQVSVAFMLPALLIGRVQVRDFDATEARVAIKVPPPQETPSEHFTRLPFPLTINHASIGLFKLKSAPDREWLDFREVATSLAWSDDLIQIKDAAASFLSFGRLQTQGAVRFLPGGLRIENTSVSGPGQFKVDMRIGYDDHFELVTQWQDLHYPFTGEPLVTSAKGEARAAGTWNAYEYSLSGDAQTQGIKLSVKSEGQGTLAALEVKKLGAQIYGGTVSAQGRVQWLPALLIEADGSAININPALLAKDWPGVLNGQFQVTTTLKDEQPQISFTAALKNSKLRGYPLQAQARGSWRKAFLQLDDALLQSGNSRLQLRGQALPPFDLTAQLDSPSLAQLWPELQGKAQLKATLQGPRDALVIGLHGQGSQLHYQNLSAQQLSVNADLAARGNSTLDVKGTGIAAGIALTDLHLQGKGTADQHALTLTANGENGRLNLQAAGALDLEHKIWHGSITQGEIAPRDLGAWTLQEPAELRVTQTDVQLQPACWRSDDGRACFQLQRAAHADIGIAFRVENFALAYFKTFLPKGWSLLGSVSGTGDLLARDLNSMRMDITTTEGRLSQGSRTVLNFLPSTLSLKPDNNGLVAQLQLPLSIGRVEANARLAPGADFAQRALSGAIKLNVPNLDWLRLLIPEIESMAGHMDGELQLTGTAGKPGFKGEVELLEGRMKLATPGIELAPLQLKISGSSDASLLVSADAKSGGGNVHLEGTLDNSQPKTSLRLSLTGENFQMMNTPEARIWISPTLQLLLDGRNIQVGGLIKVPKAQITPTTFETGIAPSGDQIIVNTKGEKPEESLWRVSTGIRLELGDDVSFDGLGLKSQLTGAVTATDEPGRPTSGRGEIVLQGGRYKAYGQDLSIETGRLIFNGGPITRPALEIRATRKPTDDITVGVYVRGTLDAPQFSLYSTPVMPQERQLSWLVLGRSLDEEGSSADRSKVSDAALALGLTGGDYLSQKIGIGKRVGLDTVSVSARPGQTSDQAQLTLGKYLSPKLFVSYGVGLFQKGYSFRLLYDIGRGFKLQTETGVESGGDLLYTIEH